VWPFVYKLSCIETRRPPTAGAHTGSRPWMTLTRRRYSFKRRTARGAGAQNDNKAALLCQARSARSSVWPA
jgi:hypothetical protein